MKKVPAVIVLFLLTAAASNAQNFSRVIQMQSKRMNGPDVIRVQQRLLALGFKKTGAADGWYGPLTEASVKTVQQYMGFSRDGKVTRAFWNVLFDPKQDGLLRNIGIISNYVPGAFVVTAKRDGSNSDFDEFTASSLNNEVKTVLFRHVNEGLVIFRFNLTYLADAVFMIQDVYYGDYRTRVYVKTSEGFFEINNGVQNPADPAMEGIFNRVKEGISSAGLTVPPLIPASLPATPAPAENQSKSPQQAPAVPENKPAQSAAPANTPAPAGEQKTAAPAESREKP